jgi:ubiquinone/menaquinone biosynthesis C-methylase UbiE
MYGEEYYKRCKEKGIDYAFYGNWQRNYAKMVIYVTEIFKNELSNKAILDVGSACGVNLRAFKETGVFTQHIGIDISKYLVNIGNKKHGFKEGELIVDSCTEMKHIENESIDLLHCSQLFEHLEGKHIIATIDQFERVLKVGGVAFITLNAVKKGQTSADVTSQDPTHITVLTEKEWADLFRRFEMKKDAELLLKKANFFPGNDSRNFYEHYYDDWSVFVFTKQ